MTVAPKVTVKELATRLDALKSQFDEETLELFQRVKTLENLVLENRIAELKAQDEPKKRWWRR